MASLTSALAHVDALHPLFNLSWLWVFGSQIEEELGHPRTFGLFALLAVGSGAAEYAYSSPSMAIQFLMMQATSRGRSRPPMFSRRSTDRNNAPSSISAASAQSLSPRHELIEAFA